MAVSSSYCTILQRQFTTSLRLPVHISELVRIRHEALKEEHHGTLTFLKNSHEVIDLEGKAG